MMKQVDTDGGGTVDFEEFVTVYVGVQNGTIKCAAFEKLAEEWNAMMASLDDDSSEEEGEKAGGDEDKGEDKAE